MCLLKRTFFTALRATILRFIFRCSDKHSQISVFFCDTMSAFRDYAWPSKQRTGQPSELHVYSSLGQQVFQSACMHGTCIRPQAETPTSKHKATQGIQPMLFQCWPASPLLAQHWNSIGWMPRVCWEDCIIFLQFSHLPRKHKVVHHHVSVSQDLYLCRYSHVIIMSVIIFCLHSLSTWKARQAVHGGISFLC